VTDPDRDAMFRTTINIVAVNICKRCFATHLNRYPEHLPRYELFELATQRLARLVCAVPVANDTQGIGRLSIDSDFKLYKVIHPASANGESSSAMNATRVETMQAEQRQGCAGALHAQ